MTLAKIVERERFYAGSAQVAEAGAPDVTGPPVSNTRTDLRSDEDDIGLEQARDLVAAHA